MDERAGSHVCEPWRKRDTRADRNLTSVARKSAFWGNAWKSNPLKQQRHATFASPPGKPFSQYLFWRMTAIDWMLMTLDSIRLFRSSTSSIPYKRSRYFTQNSLQRLFQYFRVSVISTQKKNSFWKFYSPFRITFMLIFKSSFICIQKKEKNFKISFLYSKKLLILSFNKRKYVIHEKYKALLYNFASFLAPIGNIFEQNLSQLSNS